MARMLLGVTVMAAVAVAGCSREVPFPDRTARVGLGGETTTFEVEACTLDGQTAYVVGRADDGRVLQAVVGVEPDGTTGVPGSTGITVADGDAGVAAFGEEAWSRRGEAGDPPGTITSARIRGARIQAQGQAQPVDDEDRPRPGAQVALSLDARCNEEGEG